MGTRRALKAAAVLVVAALALAACGSSGGGDSAGGKGGKVEVFSWWTSGGEKAGLDGLVATFNQQCPGQQFINAAIAGGTGTNAKQVLASRLQQGDPPETFQAHAGAEILDYIKAGQVQDLSSEYKEWGLDQAFPKSLLDNLTYQGKIYSVPANIHRIVLWGNTAVLKKAGISTAPKNFDDFIAQLDKLKASGIKAPLAEGVDWTQLELLETILLSRLGTATFLGLFKQGADWTSPAITSALQDFKKVLTYTNSDRENLDWTDAEKNFVAGQNAYFVMGDWMAGELAADNFKDYNYAPFPGTEGTYQWLADSFTLPVGAKNVTGAKCWLKTVASAEGQKAFNTKKGSIPARTDADPADYPAYQQSAIADFKKDQLVPSCANGSACSLSEGSAITSAIGKFSTDGNVDALQKAIGSAVKDYGPKSS